MSSAETATDDGPPAAGTRKMWAVPPPSTGPLSIVHRPELVARLERGLGGGVTVISAPAGSGKTELLRSWIASSGLNVAWVTIDRSEADPQRFWSDVAAALRAATGGEAVTDLAPAPAYDATSVIEALHSELQTLDQPVLLVIDDLHELSSTAALAELEAFLLNLPEQIRVVLAFRGAIRMRLHRLRLAGRLTEIPATSLRLSVDETAALLAASGVQMSDGDIQSLHERTEGWPAGVRLVAFSLADHPEPERFVREFSGVDRSVSDYLLDEILEHQSAEVRSMLLRTSILDRVSGPLADALTGEIGNEEMLRELEDKGAFVESLDASRTWFRFHRLFSDLLRVELSRTAPQEIRGLHAAAAQWFAAEGSVVEAIRHAQAAEDWALAVALLTDRYFSLTLDGRQATACDMLRSFPKEAVSVDPQLALLLAADEIAKGNLEASTARLALAERHAAAVPADRERRFAAGVALVRLAHARSRGDFASVRDLVFPADLAEHPETWLDLSLHDDVRIWALMSLGIVATWGGESEVGAQYLEEALELARRVGRRYLELGCLANLAATVPGKSFIDAQAASVRVIEAAEEAGLGADPVIAPALVTLAASLLQTGRFAEAELWLERVEQSLVAELEPSTAYLYHGVAGALALAQGRTEEAAASYGRAADLAKLSVRPPRLLSQFKAAGLIARLRGGDGDAVRAELASMGDEDRAVGEMGEVLAMIALADGDPAAALEALAPIVDGRAVVHHASVRIRALLLSATIHHRLDVPLEAEDEVEQALDLAEVDHLILPFAHVDCRDVLESHPRHRTTHLALLVEILDVLSGTSLPAVAADPAPLREELTEVELRVLRFLPSNLTTPEIAGELYVSVNTVKTHLKHVYRKLGAHTRGQALERARSLGLLSRSRRSG